MNANEAPEKLFLDATSKCGDTVFTIKNNDTDIEYVRTDAFIEKALKWYCLDCECNGNCKNTKCFFYDQYERYLNGETNAIPPKFSDRIINENGSVSEEYRYRHFINRMQESFIEKACEWLKEQDEMVGISFEEDFIERFKNYMEGK